MLQELDFYEEVDFLRFWGNFLLVEIFYVDGKDFFYGRWIFMGLFTEGFLREVYFFTVREVITGFCSKDFYLYGEDFRGRFLCGGGHLRGGVFTGKIFIGRIFTENNECRSLVSVNYNGE